MVEDVLKCKVELGLGLSYLQDALESAMRNSLWGHALLLASKMDGRTHANVMTRYDKHTDSINVDVRCCNTASSLWI